jgi:D-threo-aldose 1-dehydrogenase
MSDLKIPQIVFGTAGLGNLFVSMNERKKFDIVKECIDNFTDKPLFDSAGKYGAGMALEILGRSLKKLNIKPEDVIISNKLGWLRTELRTEEPTFESGVWKNLEYDAVQKISYDGIIECFEQGNELLNGYIPKMVSVHDPDEYLSRAKSEKQDKDFYNDILNAYEALYDLKKKSKVQAIGVGAKDWKIIQRIANDVPLDWVMIANSMTIKNHPKELLNFIQQLKKRGTVVINAAIFHSGFLVGGYHYDYKFVTSGTPSNDSLFKWRDDFFEVCQNFQVKPAEACVKFAINVPGVDSIALGVSSPKEVKENIAMVYTKIPIGFWKTLIKRGLISEHFDEHINSLTF